MAETEENGDWRALISSPKSVNNLFSGFLADGFSSPSAASMMSADGGFLGGSGIEVGMEAVKMEGSSDWKLPSGRNGSGGGGGARGGSFSERRAARCGFNAPKINTARFRSTSPLSSPSVRSPYLTIPPGLSPTSLLDSPVMLPNAQALPSPTTGTFQLPNFSFESTMPISTTSNFDKDKNADLDCPFMFKPHVEEVSLHYASGSDNQVALPANRAQNMEMLDVEHQVLDTVQKQVGFECQSESLKQTMEKNCATGSPSDMEVSNNLIVNSKCFAVQLTDPDMGNEQASENQEQLHVEDTGSQLLFEGEQRGGYPSTGTGRPSEDGYNWRKYGQKQVKGSEYPRSYYKCTHPNCPVKKKIERSHDGQITEIIYKGAPHNHPKPQPSRRSALGSAFQLGEMPEIGEDSGSYVKVEGGSAWRSTSQGPNDNRGCSDWRPDGLERTCSTSVVTDLSDPLSTAQGKQLGVLETADTPELSSTHASHEDEEDRATQGSISLGDDADDDESESKRRKRDSCVVETNVTSRAVREPRVVVQTDSEVDILDDGYRWRKYGQKVVKGNPNPRSYYKCTNAGCSVRKHVERASHDLKYVITTYEGKHNHEVPAARSSSHVNSSGGSVSSASTNAQATMTVLRSTSIPKPEPQVQDVVPRFRNNDLFKPNNLGGFGSDMKFVPASCYDMKLPHFQPAMPLCGSFAMNPNHNEAARQATAPTTQVFPEFPLAMPMNIPLSGNMALAGFDFNSQGKGLPPSAQSLFRGQQPKDGDMRFVRPKQEQKDDGVYESQMPVNINHVNASSSVYQQMMGGGFPL